MLLPSLCRTTLLFLLYLLVVKHALGVDLKLLNVNESNVTFYTNTTTSSHMRSRRRLYNVDGTITIGGSAVGPFTLERFQQSQTSGTTQIYQMSPDPIPAGTTIVCQLDCSLFGFPVLRLKFGSMFTSNNDGEGGNCDSCKPVFFCQFQSTTATAQTGYVMVWSLETALDDATIICGDLNFAVDGTITVDGASVGPFSLAEYTISDVAGTTQIYQMSPNPITGGTTVICELSCDSGNGNLYLKYGSVFTSSTDGSGGFCSCSSSPCRMEATTSTSETGYVMVNVQSGSVTNADLVCATPGGYTSDGTLTVDGGDVGPFSLGAFTIGDKAGTTQIYQLSPDPIPAGNTVMCQITSCDGSSTGSHFIALKFGSIFSSETDGTGSICACGSGCDVELATASDQTGYVMLYAISGSITDANLNCIMGVPSAAPSTPPTAPPNKLPSFVLPPEVTQAPFSNSPTTPTTCFFNQISKVVNMVQGFFGG